jgi:SPP1 gp7 family putative phage head morphogenesis protein
MASFLFAPAPNDEAAAFIASKPAVSRSVFNKLLPELKARAFTITGIASADVLQAARDEIAKLPQGGDWDDIKQSLVTKLSPYFVDESAPQEDRDKQTAAANRRAELLLRTHGQQAYASAQYGMLNEQRELFPFWQYMSLGDSHVRPSHAALDGIVLPADHEFWQTHFPPWDWGCRCQCIPLTRHDTAQIAQKQQSRPADQQDVLGDYAQADLTVSRRLVRNGVSYNVTAPREEGKPGAYAFHPGDLRISPETLKSRYDAQTFAGFEQWAKGQVLDGPGFVGPDGKPVTVWEWMHGMSAPVAVPDDDWPHPDKVEIVKALGGSTGAELVKDPRTGRLFVRKRGSSPEHLREEAAADQLYRALGAPVPESRVTDTPSGPVKLAEYIEGKTMAQYLKGATAARKKAILAVAAQHFGADALLGNWDVAGMGMDNLLVDEQGKVWRIDNGGALRFRAQGQPKDAGWNAFPTELWTMRDPAKNADVAQLFGGLDIFAIARQIEALDPSVIAAAPDAVRPMLAARLANLRSIAGKALDMEHDQWKAGYTDHLTRHTMSMRAAGVFDHLSASLTQRAGTVKAVDENGLDWDHLRSHGVAAPRPAAAVATDPHYQPLLNAIKSLNKHGAAGDFQYNVSTIHSAQSHQPQLEQMEAHGTPAQKAMAAHYLPFLDHIQQAVTGVAHGHFHQIPAFTQHTAAPAPAGPATASAAPSVVQSFAAYCQAHGLSNAPASSWMGAQAGNSWNADARAYKFFLAQHLGLPDAAHYWGDTGKSACEANWQTFTAKHGPSVEQSLIARHAMVQEILGKMDFRYNDRARRAVRLVRTESLPVMQAEHVRKGPDRLMPRGPNASSSIFRKTSIHGSETTVQAVPHSRITALYMIERDAGLANGSFLNDTENEVTFIPAAIPFDYVASASFAGGADATQWGLNLSHLRP